MYCAPGNGGLGIAHSVMMSYESGIRQEIHACAFLFVLARSVVFADVCLQQHYPDGSFCSQTSERVYMVTVFAMSVSDGRTSNMTAGCTCGMGTQF